MERKNTVFDPSMYYDIACCADAIILRNTVGDIPSAEELKSMYTFSSGFESRMNRVISSVPNRRTLPASVRRIIIIAAVIAALILGALSAGAIYNALRTLHMQEQGNHSIATYASPDTSYIAEDQTIRTHYEPSFVPDGYSEVRRSDYITSSTIVYNCGQDSIVFRQSGIDAVMQLDTEKAEISNIAVDGTDVCCIKKNGHIIMVWEENGYVFTLEGCIPYETAIQMMSGVQ